MVDFDLSMSFRIGPGPDEATSFVYKLGADRFDELVAAEMEETVRSLAYGTTHDKVDHLQEEFSAGLLSTLNSKVALYGVQVVNVKITDVTLPADIRDRLEKVAALKTDMSEREKIHEIRIRGLEDEAARSIEVTRISNERRLREIEAERIRYGIERRVAEEGARGRARVEEMKAMTDADGALKRRLGNETVEKVVARQQAEALMKKAHIQCQRMRIEAEKNVDIEVKKSETELADAESKAVRFTINVYRRSASVLNANSGPFFYASSSPRHPKKGLDDRKGRSRIGRRGCDEREATVRARVGEVESPGNVRWQSQSKTHHGGQGRRDPLCTRSASVNLSAPSLRKSLKKNSSYFCMLSGREQSPPEYIDISRRIPRSHSPGFRFRG